MAEDTYGEMFGEMIRRMLKYESQGDIFRRCGIRKRHYYSVINPNAKTSGENCFTMPLEWLVTATNDSRDFQMIKQVARDCRGFFIAEEEVENLDPESSEQVLEGLKQIIGKIKERKSN